VREREREREREKVRERERESDRERESEREREREFARLSAEEAVRKIAAVDMKTVLEGFQPNMIPSTITEIGAKAGVALANWMEKQSHMVANMPEVVAKFREKRKGYAELVKPRPRVLFSAVVEAEPDFPMPLFQTYQDIVSGSFEWQEYVFNADYTVKDLQRQKCCLLALSVCGFLKIERSDFHVVTFNQDELDVCRAANRMQTLDMSTDMRELVALAPKAADAPEQLFNQGAADALVGLLKKWGDGDEVPETSIDSAADPFYAQTVASQVAETSAKRNLEAAASAAGSGDQPGGKRLRKNHIQGAVELTEESLAQHKTALASLIKLFMTTRSSFVNSNALQKRLSAEMSEETRKGVVSLSFAFMESLGLGKIGGHQSSLTFASPEERHRSDVSKVMALLSGANEPVIRDRLVSRPIKADFDYASFRQAAQKGGVLLGPLADSVGDGDAAPAAAGHSDEVTQLAAAGSAAGHAVGLGNEAEPVAASESLS
jgi:hypothetical protein